MASRQLVLFLFLLVCINFIVLGYIFDDARLLYLSGASVLVAMIVAMRDFLSVPSDAEYSSSLLSVGMLWYLGTLFSLWYMMQIAPAVLAITAVIAFLILIGLLLKRGKKFAFFLGVVSLIGGASYFFTHLPIKPSSEKSVIISGQDFPLGSGSDLLSGDDVWSGVYEDDSVLVWTGSWDIIVTWATAVEDQEKVIAAPVSKNLLSITRDQRIATYANFLPLLLKKYQLSSKGNISFSFVSKTNVLYPAFLAAYQKWLIWIHTNPTAILKCKYVMTMIGLLEAPALQKWSTNVHTTYWEYAKKRWYLVNGCDQKEEVATYTTLP
jgi:hypothetical protein